MADKNNLWILTEEKPNNDVFIRILEQLQVQEGWSMTLVKSKVRLLPLTTGDDRFSFTYQLLGVKSRHFEKIYVRLYTGQCGVLDYQVYLKREQPQLTDKPIAYFETIRREDLTNTLMMLRTAKFAQCRRYVDKPAHQYLLFIDPKELSLVALPLRKSTVLALRLMKTIGVEILDDHPMFDDIHPFTDLIEMMDTVNIISTPRFATNARLRYMQIGSSPQAIISAVLLKAGVPGHLYNIALVGSLGCALRDLGWDQEIVIIDTGLDEVMTLKHPNRLVLFMEAFGLIINAVTLKAPRTPPMWQYDHHTKRIVSFFMQVLMERYSPMKLVFDHHHGCEESWFIKQDGYKLEIDAAEPNEASSKRTIKKMELPDLAYWDPTTHDALLMCAQPWSTRWLAYKRLSALESFQKRYLEKLYPCERIQTIAIVSGSMKHHSPLATFGFILNDDGALIIEKGCPKPIQDICQAMLHYWSKHNSSIMPAELQDYEFMTGSMNLFDHDYLD